MPPQPPLPSADGAGASAFSHAQRLRGCLLGCAVGDALGLPAEGLSPTAIALRFEPLARYRLIGRRGYVSDDTEQSALLASALCGTHDDGLVRRRLRRSLVGWFWRLPFGIGLATLRACLKLSLGWRNSGVDSAGNGAAMRAPILGVALAEDPQRRRALGRELALLTHTHPAAVEGALFCAEVGALCCQDTPLDSVTARARLIQTAAAVIEHAPLREAVEQGLDAAMHDRLNALGTSGWVLHSLAICCWAFVSHRGFEAVRAVIRAGGDTDTHAAIVGAWVGAAGGPDAIPSALRHALQSGPFGEKHLTQIADALAAQRAAPRFSALRSLLRNLSLYPVILGHGFWRLIRR